MTLSTNLQKQLTDRGMTVTEFARQVGIAQPVIYRLVKGENTNPKLDTLLAISDYLKLSLSELIGEHVSHTHLKTQVPLVQLATLTEAGPLLSNVTEWIMVNKTEKVNHFAIKVDDESFFSPFSKGTLLIFSLLNEDIEAAGYILYKQAGTMLFAPKSSYKKIMLGKETITMQAVLTESIHYY